MTPSATGDLVLRVAGGLLSLLAGGLAGLLAVLLVPLRVAGAAEVLGLTGLPGTEFGATRLPTAVLLAIGGNLLLVRLAESVTGARWAGLLPGLGWFAVMLLALRTTAEGDRLLLDGDWVGGLTLFGGTVVLVIMIVHGLVTPRVPAAAAGVRPPAGVRAPGASWR